MHQQIREMVFHSKLSEHNEAIDQLFNQIQEKYSECRHTQVNDEQVEIFENSLNTWRFNPKPYPKTSPFFIWPFLCYKFTNKLGTERVAFYEGEDAIKNFLNQS